MATIADGDYRRWRLSQMATIADGDYRRWRLSPPPADPDPNPHLMRLITKVEMRETTIATARSASSSTTQPSSVSKITRSRVDELLQVRPEACVFFNHDLKLVSDKPEEGVRLLWAKQMLLPYQVLDVYLVFGLGTDSGPTFRRDCALIAHGMGHLPCRPRPFTGAVPASLFREPTLPSSAGPSTSLEHADHLNIFTIVCVCWSPRWTVVATRVGLREHRRRPAPQTPRLPRSHLRGQPPHRCGEQEPREASDAPQRRSGSLGDHALRDLSKEGAIFDDVVQQVHAARRTRGANRARRTSITSLAKVKPSDIESVRSPAPANTSPHVPQPPNDQEPNPSRRRTTPEEDLRSWLPGWSSASSAGLLASAFSQHRVTPQPQSTHEQELNMPNAMQSSLPTGPNGDNLGDDITIGGDTTLVADSDVSAAPDSHEPPNLQVDSERFQSLKRSQVTAALSKENEKRRKTVTIQAEHPFG
ncbi:hypothetical protein CMUS01_12474 [Colletotrichum musicola]|uniref:Uncharacterized protein n=1 Tax=Colletotrichum musicola TaxID=2175873 RepID=A0A8H6JMG0_9PEZI|nr:hypothetical protein CMUS01_12474 [Colletotrichum musicola]